MRKLTVAALLAAALSLTSCAVSSGEERSHEEHHIKLEDGREVLCISLTLIGTFSCDWANAK